MNYIVVCNEVMH